MLLKVVGIVLTILAGVEHSFTSFDSMGFYLVHFAIGVLGCICMLRKMKLGLLVVS